MGGAGGTALRRNSSHSHTDSHSVVPLCSCPSHLRLPASPSWAAWATADLTHPVEASNGD